MPPLETATKSYTLFEHEQLPFAWRDRHLRLLQHAKLAKGGDVLTATIYKGQRILKASHFVGTLRLGSDTITILPKIDFGADRVQSATRNLLFMLEQAGYLPVQHQTIAPMLQRGRDWFELLTRIFAAELLAQWSRGSHRHYQLIEDNLSAVRGKWRVHRQLRQPARDHRFDVIYDEFTPDNPLSRVFRYVVEQLWMRTRDDGSRRLLGELRQTMDEVFLEPYLTIANIPQGIINRLNKRYEPLLNLAKLFLSNGSLELTQGNLQAFAFVFNMNQLFEEFLVAFITRHRVKILPEGLQDCTLHSQAKRHAKHLAVSEEGRSVYLLKPDLAFRRGDDFPLLVDAKYKTLNPEDRRLSARQSDFYQMFAYAHRYHSPRVLMLYPQIAEPQRAIFNLVNYPATISGATINLHRDLGRPENQRALVRELKEALSMEIRYGSNV